MFKFIQTIILLLNKYYKKFKIYLSYHKRKTALIAVALFVIIFIFYVSVFRAPSEFPSGKTFTIEEGETLSSVAKKFKQQDIVMSSLWLRNFVIMFNGERKIFSGDYFFDEPESVFSIARRITNGDFDLSLMKVVIPEGSTNYEIGKIFEEKSDLFDFEEFETLVDGKEGYLFPDTYLFMSNMDAKEVARKLNNNFIEKITEIEDEIRNFNKPINEIIIMASILEKEARTTETRRMIAGILWERLNIDMPLQVDAVFTYANGKNSFTLTTSDLQENHPYNTYTNKGLPPTPISNPGLDSIRSAINPIKSDYLYFLSDKSGNMYYSENFSEHVRKKRIYLN